MNTSGDLEAELSSAKAHLARLERNQKASRRDPALSIDRPGAPADRRDAADANDDDDDDDAAAAAESLLLRARQAEDRIELIAMNRRVVDLVANVAVAKENNNGPDAAAGASDEGAATALVRATETCTALGLLLLRHRRRPGVGVGESVKFRAALVRWHASLHDSTRRAALETFRTRLRAIAPEYPSNERSCASVGEAVPSDVAARCLVELQAIRDALLWSAQSQCQEDDAQNNDNDDPSRQQQQHRQQHNTLPSPSNLDVVDELCRPLAERLRFHFLEDRTGILSHQNSGDARHPQTTSEMDRFPEWLFRYLRETVDDRGALSSAILGGVRPLVDSVVDSLIARASLSATMDDGDSFFGSDRDDAPGDGGDPFDDAGEADAAVDALGRLRRQYRNLPAACFLREVARMARHALRAKSFFRHPDVVGSECRDRTIVLRGIEQLFLFDSFLGEKMEEAEDGEEEGASPYRSVEPPRIVDAFLSSDEFLLRWWLDEERDGIVSSLHRCAEATLSSYQSRKEEDGEPGQDAEASAGVANQQQLYPPVSELFVALLHSARCKSRAFLDRRARQMYVANVVAPLCSEYLDMVHVEAARLRRCLLARPATGASVLRSANLPSDELLASNAAEWASLITGTHLAARAVLQDSSDDVLDRVGESMERLCDAMAEDFTSAFVETIVMERAKLASYVMRAPFLLSEPPSPERRGQRDKDGSGDTLSLSPDLNDSIHVVSLGVKACDATMRKLRDMDDDRGIDEQPSEAIGPNAMLHFGSRSVREALKFAIGQKMLDVAIDPQGMTPEIYLGGARQFRHDVVAFERLFGGACGDDGVEEEGIVVARDEGEPGPMERAVTAARLMSLQSSSMRTIREALRSLVVPSGGIGSLFGRRVEESTAMGENDNTVGEAGGRLDVDEFYRDERLMEEAIGMLEAKGFAALSLNESLSIINRRC